MVKSNVGRIVVETAHAALQGGRPIVARGAAQMQLVVPVSNTCLL